MLNSNAILTVNIPSTTPTGRDPVTGRPIFGVASSLTINCFLEQKKPSTDFQLKGVDNPICYLEGRTEGIPTVTLTPNVFYPITITLQSGTKTGRFKLLSTPVGGLGLNPMFGGVFISGYLLD